MRDACDGEKNGNILCDDRWQRYRDTSASYRSEEQQVGRLCGGQDSDGVDDQLRGRRDKHN